MFRRMRLSKIFAPDQGVSPSLRVRKSFRSSQTSAARRVPVFVKAQHDAGDFKVSVETSRDQCRR